MKVLKADQKLGLLEIVPEVPDDLWHLERIIEKGDIVSGETDRKIKGNEGEQVKRIKLFVELEVEGAEFHKFSGLLRVNGTIVSGKPEEFIEQRAHQSLDLELGKKISVKKKSLKAYQLERLKKAQNATRGSVLLVVLDDESASFAVLKEFSLEEKASIRGSRKGKQLEGEEGEDAFFSEILEKAKQSGLEKIVFAGPGFTKDKLKAFLAKKGELKPTHFFEPANSVGRTGLNELLKSDALQKIVQEMQVLKDARLLEKILAELGRNSGMACYGLKEIGGAIDSGAVELLLVSDKMLLSNRDKAEELMDKAEKSRAEAHIVSSETEAGKKLDSFGGSLALLRYRLNY